jgi:hypothetical protein
MDSILYKWSKAGPLINIHMILSDYVDNLRQRYKEVLL